MSVYSTKGKGWRYDFTHKGTGHTAAWFNTKKEAKSAEAEKRKELENPPEVQELQTDMAFLELVNLRLDHVHSYNSNTHYVDVRYHCRRWVELWKDKMCSEISTKMVEAFLKRRLKVSAHVANKELQYLRALFNYGIKKAYIRTNPTHGIDFFPTDKRKKYIPPKEEVFRVIAQGKPEEQAYLWTFILTAARMGEVNSMTWDDVDFDRRLVTLWTRKRKGGNREPREVPMTEKLYDILDARFKARDCKLPWVFWHTYWSRKQIGWVQGPYGERKQLMANLCKRANVRYFRYHALRHLTASILDDMGVPIGVIQRILGHKNRRTTEIYLHSVGDSEREAMAKLENSAFFKNQTHLPQASATNQHLAYWNRKVERPSYERLQSDIDQLGYCGTGRKYGVSDNAIRKWVAAYRNQMGAGLDALNPGSKKVSQRVSHRKTKGLAQQR